MYDTIILILTVVILSILSPYIYNIAKKYSWQNRMADYIYNEINEKLKNYDFLIQSYKTPESVLSSGFFEIGYLDNCVSDEEKIKNRLLNIDNNIKNSIYIANHEGSFYLKMSLSINNTIIIYHHFFEFRIHRKDDIKLILKELEKIKIIRDVVLYCEKINFSDDKENAIKNEIQKNLKLVNNSDKLI